MSIRGWLPITLYVFLSNTDKVMKYVHNRIAEEDSSGEWYKATSKCSFLSELPRSIVSILKICVMK